MTITSKILLINLAVFTTYAVYGKSNQDIGTLMLLILLQFIVNLVMGFAAREGKAAYFLSAFLVPIIGFAVCVYEW
jgi:lipopolysaccharide export LptBFGC system permease protein LptF